MQKPNDFDNASRESFRSLPAGGYICNILRLEERVSKSGNPMIAVAIDIADGPFKGYIRQQFERALKKNQQAKWPNIGMAYCLTENDDGSTHPNFKNFIECVKESNSGFQPVWGDKFAENFKHRKVGVVFGREQYMPQDGMSKNDLRWSTKPDFGHFKSVDDIRNGKYSTPEDKPYKGGTVELVPAAQDNGIPDGFEAISEDDVPF